MLEKAIGHRDNAIIEQDVSNPAIDRSKYADPSGETMKALLWEGKNTVKVGVSHLFIFSFHFSRQVTPTTRDPPISPFSLVNGWRLVVLWI